MAVNSATAVYGTNNIEHYRAVVDVDIKSPLANDVTRTSAKAQVVIVAGTISPDGSLTPTGAQPLTAGTNHSGSVPIANEVLIAADPARVGGSIINNDAVHNIGISEFGVAVIGAAGTTTVVPGATYIIRTSNAINAIAATAPVIVTAITW